MSVAAPACRARSSSGKCSTGLATLRRDGFASLRSESAPGTVTTRPIMFQGQQLFVNADVARGELLAEILDEDGAVIPPFSRDRCVPMQTSSTCQRIDWSGASSLASLRGRIVSRAVSRDARRPVCVLGESRRQRRQSWVCGGRRAGIHGPTRYGRHGRRVHSAN